MKIRSIIFFLIISFFSTEIYCSAPADAKAAQENAALKQPDAQAASPAKKDTEKQEKESASQTGNASQSATQTSSSAAALVPKPSDIVRLSATDREDLECYAQAVNAARVLQTQVEKIPNSNHTICLTKTIIDDVHYNALAHFLFQLNKRNISPAMLLNSSQNARIKKQLGSHASVLCDHILLNVKNNIYAYLQEVSPIDPTLQQLINAILANDQSKVNTYAPLVSKINSFDQFGFTPLHYAAIVGDSKLITTLTTHGAQFLHTTEGILPCLLYFGDNQKIKTQCAPIKSSDKSKMLNDALSRATVAAYGVDAFVVGALFDAGASPDIEIMGKNPAIFFSEISQKFPANTPFGKHVRIAQKLFTSQLKKRSHSMPSFKPSCLALAKNVDSNLNQNVSACASEELQGEVKKSGKKTKRNKKPSQPDNAKAELDKDKEQALQKALELEKQAQAQRKADEDAKIQEAIKAKKAESLRKAEAEKQKKDAKNKAKALKKEAQRKVEEEARLKEEEAQRLAQLEKERLARELAQKEAQAKAEALYKEKAHQREINARLDAAKTQCENRCMAYTAGKTLSPNTLEQLKKQIRSKLNALPADRVDTAALLDKFYGEFESLVDKECAANHKPLDKDKQKKELVVQPKPAIQSAAQPVTQISHNVKIKDWKMREKDGNLGKFQNACFNYIKVKNGDASAYVVCGLMFNIWKNRTKNDCDSPHIVTLLFERFKARIEKELADAAQLNQPNIDQSLENDQEKNNVAQTFAARKLKQRTFKQMKHIAGKSKATAHEFAKKQLQKRTFKLLAENADAAKNQIERANDFARESMLKRFFYMLKKNAQHNKNLAIEADAFACAHARINETMQEAFSVWRNQYVSRAQAHKAIKPPVVAASGNSDCTVEKQQPELKAATQTESGVAAVGSYYASQATNTKSSAQPAAQTNAQPTAPLIAETVAERLQKKAIHEINVLIRKYNYYHREDFSDDDKQLLIANATSKIKQMNHRIYYKTLVSQLTASIKRDWGNLLAQNYLEGVNAFIEKQKKEQTNFNDGGGSGGQSVLPISEKEKEKIVRAALRKSGESTAVQPQKGAQ